jgi:putative MATE family efflux protein
MLMGARDMAVQDVGIGASAPLPARTRLLLEGPILGTLLRLAAPNLGEAAARILFIACDAVFVGWLGTDALAGASLVFPIFLVMQLTSASGLGAGVAAAVARAMGAGRRADADALAAHAVMLALGAASLCAALMLADGPGLYAALGATGGALDAAALYSALLFGLGAPAVWLMNTLANVVRGTGNMVVPAGAIVLGEAVHLALSPALILGWGPFPPLGIAGAALAVIACYGGGAALLLLHLVSGRGAVRLRWRGFGPRLAYFRDILRVGALAALNVVQWQVAVFIVTAAVASFGAAPLAGYGAATRLELLLFPLTFALGTAAIAMVATNLGAGAPARARQAAWTAVALSALLGLVFAAVALLLPRAWMRLFSDDPAVIAAGAQYLGTVGVTYVALGFGVGLVFTLQGMGCVLWPLLAGTLRVALIAAGTWSVVRGLWDGTPGGLFLVVADTTLVFALAMLAASQPLLRRPDAVRPARAARTARRP